MRTGSGPGWFQAVLAEGGVFCRNWSYGHLAFAVIHAEEILADIFTGCDQPRTLTLCSALPDQTLGLKQSDMSRWVNLTHTPFNTCLAADEAIPGLCSRLVCSLVTAFTAGWQDWKLPHACDACKHVAVACKLLAALDIRRFCRILACQWRRQSCRNQTAGPLSKLLASRLSHQQSGSPVQTPRLR